MSGIVGLVRSDGQPPDARLVRRMTDSLADRGPDGGNVWRDDCAAFGHTMLRTTFEAADEEQPASLDGAVWIVADARVDARTALLGKLAARGVSCPRTASDVQLLLSAYQAWGEACVDHLLGDFAFAIWDRPRRRLFCARDHFGIKPFYYAHVDDSVIFSNTLECVRLHPRVRNAVNERAIGDFLLFGANVDSTTTAFLDIRRLPPAHRLTWQDGTLRQTQYWAPPTDGRIRYRQPHDYVEHFREVLRSAVADRLRQGKVAVWMSGGLDSTAITAAARELASVGPAVDVRAHTIVYDSLIPDEERHYAPQAAAALGVGIDFFVADRYQPFEGFDESGVSMPEPSHDPFLLMQKRQLQWTTRHSRVLLSGLGGDEVLWPSYVVDVAHKLGPWELLEGFARSTLIHRRRPGFGVRARAERWFRAGLPPHGFPRWLNKDFADRVELRARWASVHHARMEHRHAIRGEAHRRLAGVPWPWCFEPFDAGASGVPAECRYPFLDVRLVEYLLAIPPFPWCVDKQLLRLSLQGVLPESLRTRPKTPMSGDPLREHLRRQTGNWWQRSAPAPELARFVDTTRIPSLTAPDTPDDVEVQVRPLCLNYWLCRARSSTIS